VGGRPGQLSTRRASISRSAANPGLGEQRADEQRHGDRRDVGIAAVERALARERPARDRDDESARRVGAAARRAITARRVAGVATLLAGVGLITAGG
jgi:hypothetical protein